jgi:RNA polymerase sigma-70 factor (ECF subfamily)
MLKLDLSPEEMYELHSDGHETFDKIFNKAYQPLCNYIRSMSGGTNDGTDLAIETLSKFWSNRKRYNSVEAITGFLFLTIKRAYLNIVRKEKVVKKYQKSQLNMEPVNEEIREIEAKYITALNECIETLPDKCKEIFKLIYYKGLSNKEVAQLLKIEENNVAVQKKKAIQLIRTYLINKGYFLAALLFILLGPKYFIKKHSHLIDQVVSSCVDISQSIH